MAYPVLMPKQGITVESCVITGWMKKIGDAVKTGELLYSYETDKATFEVEAEAGGTLLAIFYPEGEDIPVLTPVAAIGSPGEDVSDIDPRGKADAVPAEAPVAAPQAEPVPVAPVALTAPVRPSEPIASTGCKISPRARALAANTGLDAATLTGTGPEGRVIERDVRARLAQGPVEAAFADEAAPVAAAARPVNGFTDEKLSGVRRAISRSMTQSLTTMAQLTLSTSFDASAIFAMRKTFKTSPNPEIQGITLTDMVLFAVVRALQMPEHRHFNAHLNDDTMRFFTAVNLAFAVDTPRGLLVPVIFGAQDMTLRAMSVEVKRLAALAQDGRISPDLLTGGTFTVSNLGGIGIEHFTPVINPPQTGILGLNNITYRPRDMGGEIYPAMGLSITFDHRAVDGAPAARFVRDIGRLLESFSALLAG